MNNPEVYKKEILSSVASLLEKVTGKELFATLNTIEAGFESGSNILSPLEKRNARDVLSALKYFAGDLKLTENKHT